MVLNMNNHLFQRFELELQTPNTGQQKAHPLAYLSKRVLSAHTLKHFKKVREK